MILYLHMFLLFVYFGLVSFGGGSSLLPFFIEELVENRHWMTMQQLIDFIAISQITPGPISVNTATFLGFQQGGILGGLVCTVGLLLPSWFLMVLGLKSLDKWENSRVVQGFLYGIRPATMGLILAVLLFYLEMSVFSCEIPWAELKQYFFESAAWPKTFFVRFWTIPLFCMAGYLLLKNKWSIMAVIFASAGYGAIFCR